MPMTGAYMYVVGNVFILASRVQRTSDRDDIKVRFRMKSRAKELQA